MSESRLHGQQRQAMDVIEGMHEQEIAAGEAHQEQDRLRKEAWEARGGTPLHKAWRRITRALRTEERG